MANTVGALFTSSGALPSSFDHNCLRENDWGVANQFLPLVDARIHHNSSFGTVNFAYEQTRGADRVLFDHNLSTADDIGYLFWYSRSTTAFENTVTSARHGIRSFGGNEDLRIIGNRLEARRAGVAQGSGTLPDGSQPQPNLRALIQGTRSPVKAPRQGSGWAGERCRTHTRTSWTTSSRAWMVRASPLLTATPTTGRGNTVTNNGRNGISAGAGATDNTFEANEMLGNGRIDSSGVDARDGNPLVDGKLQNTWTNNACDTDIPTGTICGVGVATLDG
jgi:hypothetical protein